MTRPKRILLTEPMHPAGPALLDGRADFELIQLADPSPEAIAEALPDVQAIGVRTALLGEDLLARAPGLEIVSRHGVGCDSVAVDQFPINRRIHSSY